jgi:hypothetical protein
LRSIASTSALTAGTPPLGVTSAQRRKERLRIPGVDKVPLVHAEHQRGDLDCLPIAAMFAGTVLGGVYRSAELGTELFADMRGNRPAVDNGAVNHRNIARLRQIKEGLIGGACSYSPFPPGGF